MGQNRLYGAIMVLYGVMEELYADMSISVGYMCVEWLYFAFWVSYGSFVRGSALDANRLLKMENRALYNGLKCWGEGGTDCPLSAG